MVTSIPNWMKRLGVLVVDTIEGNMVNHLYLYSPQNGWTMDVHPSLLRMKNSEELLWSSFSVDLNKVIACVDEVKEFKLYEDGVILKAIFANHPFTLHLRNEPRDDAEIEGLVDEDGKITPTRKSEEGVSLDGDLN